MSHFKLKLHKITKIRIKLIQVSGIHESVNYYRLETKQKLFGIIPIWIPIDPDRTHDTLHSAIDEVATIMGVNASELICLSCIYKS